LCRRWSLRIIYSAHSSTCEIHERIKLTKNGADITNPPDDWTDPASWAKANPNWGISVNKDDIARKARKAMSTPSAQNNFLTKHLNVWVNAATAWMDMIRWEACADRSLDLSDFIGKPCYIGVDLAEKRDIAATYILFNVDGKFFGFSKFYLNEAEVERSNNSQYSGWQRAGHLIVNDGDLTDFNILGDDLRVLCNNHDVKEIDFDPRFAQYFARTLMDDGLPMVEITQASTFYTAPFMELENIIYANNFSFDGNPVMTWMVGNVMAKKSIFSGLIHPIKEGDDNKIDGVIALLMALGRTMANEDTASAYDDRGVLSF